MLRSSILLHSISLLLLYFFLNYALSSTKTMKQVYFVIAFLWGLLGSRGLWAQSDIIRGKVIDAVTREAIAGASVQGAGGTWDAGRAGGGRDAEGWASIDEL